MHFYTSWFFLHLKSRNVFLFWWQEVVECSEVGTKVSVCISEPKPAVASETTHRKGREHRGMSDKILVDQYSCWNIYSIFVCIIKSKIYVIWVGFRSFIHVILLEIKNWTETYFLIWDDSIPDFKFSKEQWTLNIESICIYVYLHLKLLH